LPTIYLSQFVYRHFIYQKIVCRQFVYCWLNTTKLILTLPTQTLSSKRNMSMKRCFCMYVSEWSLSTKCQCRDALT
jgi:hypothetical protein